MTGNGREEGREAYVDHVIEGAVLCNSDEDGLVVRGGVDRGKAVGSSRETTRDVSGEDAVLRGAVEALEERELGRVEGRGLVERGEGLDDDVRVAGDVAVGRDRLGRGEVVLVRVHERARVQVLDRHLDREVLVRGDRLPVLGEHELGRGHVRLCGDDTHRRGVAGAGRDLLAVGDREVRDRRAEVDEVVRRRERGDLASLSNVLAVVREALGDDRVKERCWVKSGVSRVRGTIVKFWVLSGTYSAKSGRRCCCWRQRYQWRQQTRQLGERPRRRSQRCHPCWRCCRPSGPGWRCCHPCWR